MPAVVCCGVTVLKVLLIAVAGVEQRFQIVLLHFLSDDLLQCLRLEHLIGLLLGAQFDQ